VGIGGTCGATTEVNKQVRTTSGEKPKIALCSSEAAWLDSSGWTPANGWSGRRGTLSSPSSHLKPFFGGVGNSRNIFLEKRPLSDGPFSRKV